MWHVTLAAQGRSALFTEPEPLLVAVRSVARALDRLMLFSIVDDHVHVVVRGTRRQAGYAGASLSRALSGAGAPAREVAHVRAVDGRRHLASLCGYLARQVLKHEVSDDAATYWVGSCAPDLLGLRVLTEYDAGAVVRALPREDVAMIVARACGLAGLPDLATDAEVRALGGAEILALALAAAGAHAHERTPAAVAARVVAAHLWDGLFDGIPDRTLRRHRAITPDPRVLLAVRRRVGLRLGKVENLTVEEWERRHPW